MKILKVGYFSLIVLVIIAGIYLWIASGDTEDVPVVVENPVAGSVVKSPLDIKGEAKGYWFFEADFPIILKDLEGNTLATSIAQTESDWMTEDFVPFSSEMTFNVSEETEAVLEFQRDNPSGLPEHDAAYEVPVTLSPSETMSVQVFFGRYSPDSSMDVCTQVYPVTREIPKTQGVGQAALKELLKGPGEGDMYTSIPEGVELNGLVVEDGVAYADFSKEMNQVGGSCRVMGIQTQIEETLKQFSSVSDVVISVEGNTEEALQP